MFEVGGQLNIASVEVRREVELKSNRNVALKKHQGQAEERERNQLLEGEVN